jgi:hypothetical protein
VLHGIAAAMKSIDLAPCRRKPPRLKIKRSDTSHSSENIAKRQHHKRVLVVGGCSGRAPASEETKPSTNRANMSPTGVTSLGRSCLPPGSDATLASQSTRARINLATASNGKCKTHDTHDNETTSTTWGRTRTTWMKTIRLTIPTVTTETTKKILGSFFFLVARALTLATPLPDKMSLNVPSLIKEPQVNNKPTSFFKT